MANAQTWWMPPAQLQRYQDLSSELLKLHKEHRSLMGKVFKKTISPAEVKRLRTVIQKFNKVHADRKALEDENPIKPENVLSALAKSKE